jgi:uncharacterized protein (DUF302 family)
MTDASYGYTVKLGQVAFGDAVDRVTAALKEEGFGVLTDIDVKATLKQKLDVDFRQYRILGACNPPLAHRSLTSEPLIGLLLPCNVVVLEEDDASITVSLANPRELFKVVENDDLAAVAGEVDAKIQRVVRALG